MGGYDTMITDRTRNILIESAWWDPATVRKMSKRHGLHTDASHRFERGADYESTLVSTNRVAELILNSAGGTLVGDAIDVVVGRRDQAPIVLNMTEVHRILGKDLSAQEVLRILGRLAFETTSRTAGRRGIRSHDSLLAPRRGTRDRRDRGNRAALRLRSLPEHAARLCRSGDRTARRAQGREAAQFPARARLRRGGVAELHLVGRCEDLLARRGDDPGQSSERRSLGHADIAPARHAEHADLQPEPRDRRRAPVRSWTRVRGRWRGRSGTEANLLRGDGERIAGERQPPVGSAVDQFLRRKG